MSRGDPGYENHIENLRNMMDSIAENKKVESEYPNIAKFQKVQALVLKKKGLSEFEIHGGVSEIFCEETV